MLLQYKIVGPWNINERVLQGYFPCILVKMLLRRLYLQYTDVEALKVLFAYWFELNNKNVVLSVWLQI